ncbi:MAG: acylneuraminate cytidylyltransferase family protein [Chloroflexi bacterium]|nr:acylneuraminate cytidylyltransferase family protein [Chloroflexota bacterium]
MSAEAIPSRKDNLHVLAAIPARGGSKGVPRKNVRLLGGMPLIGHSIDAAQRSRFRPRVVVSTDDEEIAAVSRRLGAEVPLLRPKELATDTTPTAPVIQHLLAALERAEGYVPDVVVLLQPTSPLRTASVVDAGIEALLNSDADSVVGVCLNEHPPQWLKVIGSDGYLQNFIEGGETYRRRQDCPSSYRINGALYVTRPKLIRQEGRLLGDRTLPLIMNPLESADIDTELDFLVAEVLLERTAGGH